MVRIENNSQEPADTFSLPDHTCALACECDIVDLQESVENNSHRIYHLIKELQEFKHRTMMLVGAIIQHRSPETITEILNTTSDEPDVSSGVLQTDV